jgi:hypothetical protein
MSIIPFTMIHEIRSEEHDALFYIFPLDRFSEFSEPSLLINRMSKFIMILVKFHEKQTSRSLLFR